MDKTVALREVARVTAHNGYVDVHDLCWKEYADDTLKKRLEDVEGEVLETEGGWRVGFERAGLADIVVDRNDRPVQRWRKEIRDRLGLLGRCAFPSGSCGSGASEAW